MTVDSEQWTVKSAQGTSGIHGERLRTQVDRDVAQPKDYRDLRVWKKGMSLAKQIYLITQAFPEVEKFGLISQMRRAAVSIPSNIAEGQARNTSGEFVQFLSHALGSVSELHTQLLLSIELGHCSRSKADPALARIMELRKMLTSLRKKLLAR